MPSGTPAPPHPLEPTARGAGPSCRLLALLLFAGCAGSPDASDGGTTQRDTEESGSAPTPLRSVPQPAGAVLDLRPSELVSSEQRGPDLRVVDGWWREALRQSDHFDVAGGIERAPLADAALQLRIDAVARELSLTVVEATAPETPRPLAAASYASPADLPAALDRLAWAARLGLGETLASPPIPVRRLYSSSSDCVRHYELALVDRARGLIGSARERIERARKSDPGCTLVLLRHGHDQLEGGQPAEAEATATRALRSLELRTAPTTRHRLARLALLARRQLQPSPSQLDRLHDQLLALGETSLRERPHDPHGRLTRGLARCYRAEFDLALTDLRPLFERWPRVPGSSYHLCFAELAAGDPERARAAIEAERARMPLAQTLLPRALARFAVGDTDGVQQLLDDAERRVPKDLELHLVVLLMQASHSILTDAQDRATSQLVTAIEWIRVRASQHDRLIDRLVECGDALAALGATEALSEQLAAFPVRRGRSDLLRQALTYLQGLVAARENPSGDVFRTAVTTLEQADRIAWSTRLRGRAARLSGEDDRAARELATSLRQDDAPIARIDFIQALVQLGQTEEARGLREETTRWLLEIDLRRELRHPLTGPGHAFAYRWLQRHDD